MYYQKQAAAGSSGGGHGGGRGRGGWFNSNQIGPDGRGSQYPGRHGSDLAPGMKGFLFTTNFRNKKTCVVEACGILNEYAPPEVLDDKREPAIASKGVHTELQSRDSKGESICSHPGSSSATIKTKHHGLSNEGGGDEGCSVSVDNAPCSVNEPMVIEVKVEDGSGDAIKGDVIDEKMDEDDDDVDAAIKKEVQELKSYRVHNRFESANTGVDDVIFISTTLENPLNLSEKIYEDMLATKISKPRNIIRFLPIEMTCRPNLDDIINTLEIMLPKHLGEGVKSFKIECSSRGNNKFNRTDVMQLVGDLVGKINPLTFLDLDCPTYTIVIEIIKTVVCLGVLTNFARYRKYNLAEAAIPDQKEKGESKKKDNQNKNKKKGRGGSSNTGIPEVKILETGTPQIEVSELANVDVSLTASQVPLSDTWSEAELSF